MAEESVSTTTVNGKGSDGGIPGRQLVYGVEGVQRFLEGLSSRLCFIMEGLRGDDPNLGGAIGFISDLEDRVREECEAIEGVAEQARSMVAMAVGACPILPDTTTEAELFEAIKAARGSLGARFICKAGLEAARIHKERFSFPKGGPGPEEVAEAVGATLMTAPETDLKEARHE